MPPQQSRAKSRPSSSKSNLSSDHDFPNVSVEVSYEALSVNEQALMYEIAKAEHQLLNGQVDLAQATEQARTNVSSSATAAFLALFAKELTRVSVCIQSEERNQEYAVKALLTSMDIVTSNARGRLSRDSVRGFQQKAKLQAEGYIQLQRFAAECSDILTRVATYADSQLHTCCVDTLSVSANKRSLSSAFVVVLSDVYNAIREADNQGPGGDSKWVAPSSFERVTSKYWVSEDKLTELLLGAASEAPLLVYGCSGRLTSKADCQRIEGDKLWDTLATTISSVYFDSPDMKLYRDRIARLEGAQLLRARWYGKKPTGSKPVFLELKTHHEKWVNTKSVKERVNIREADMKHFLAHRKWTIADAQSIVLAANKDMGEEELCKAANLLLTMHKLVVRLDLRPCVRSAYSRAAFQSPKDNSLRLTIDRNITLIDETRTSSGSWCLPDDAVIGSDMARTVPYAVYEIKLAGSEMPASMQALLDSGVILDAAKFSKFLTGAAAFQGGKINVLPYWAEYDTFIPLFFGKPTAANDVATPVSMATRRNFPIETTQSTSSEQSLSKTNVTGTSPFGNCASSARSRESVTKIEQRIAPKKPARVEPKSYFANERTFIQWISAALLQVTVAVILLEFESQHPEYPLVSIGLLLCGCAAVIIAYALYAYHRRVRLLMSGEPYGYIDHTGPTFLGCSIFIGLLALLIIFMNQRDPENGGFWQENESRVLPPSIASPHIRPIPRQCILHQTNGISFLDKQPSDIAVDDGRGMFIVPTMSSIHGYDVSEAVTDEVTGENTKVLVDIPGSNFESLALVGDFIFALSSKEDSLTSELVALSWVSDSQLQEQQRWTLDTPRAQGIAYVPGVDGGKGKFYISGDKGADVAPSERGFIDIYEHVEVGEHDLVSHSLNTKLLTRGLIDSKIATLQFFEGHLYVLHDHAHLVRVWNIETGVTTAEWNLPQGEQWDGMMLVRQEVEEASPSDRRLRGSVRGLSDVPDNTASTSLMLHLSAESPPEVWSFGVSEGNLPGSIVLPECAAATV